MPRELICLECSEARKEGKPPSRYHASRNKRTDQDKVEKMKYNKFLRRHTLHKAVKL
jgi:large subunit ribosomal protein L33